MNQSTIDRCAEIARGFGVKRLILFGTAAESSETAADVDFACEGLHGWNLYRFGARLEEELRKHVDVVLCYPAIVSLSLWLKKGEYFMTPVELAAISPLPWL